MLKIRSIRKDLDVMAAVVNGEGGSVEAGIFVKLSNGAQGMAEASGEDWYKEFTHLEKKYYTVTAECQGEHAERSFDMRNPEPE
ncbi:MAG: hypothetical protein JSV88_09800 [Candidatus Aminicenantes bacterium]|nr:MAG: hypothetical protein JSV88_09800 [Candidatus Aminicenantes bacterium]